MATGHADDQFLGESEEWLIGYCRNELQREYFDYMIFGHRHLPIDFHFPGGSRYINLGDWINYFTYAEFDGSGLTLQSFNPSLNSKIIRR